MKYYLNAKDLTRILNINYQSALTVIKNALEIDKQELNQYQLYKTKARVDSVSLVLGIDMRKRCSNLND